jgi:hypothetical protein
MAAPESDVSALVLTVGEPTTERAMESIRRQTLAPREVIVIRDVRPFHQALNAGAARVRTSFFIQVDADMILDPTCVAMLRAEATEDAGIVVGRLRDELIGGVVGIKLFRTRCFEGVAFRNSISPDTDFGKDIAAAGWKTLYAGALPDSGAEVWTRFGHHRPSYTIEYTYKRYLLEGRRYRYRDRIGGIRWHFDRLELSRHPAALAAQIALARGIFIAAEDDLLGTLCIDRELEMIRGFLSTADNAVSASHSPIRHDASPEELFGAGYRIGGELFRERNLSTFQALMDDLPTRKNDRNWILKVALCQGLFAQPPEQHHIDSDWQTLRAFLKR